MRFALRMSVVMPACIVTALLTLATSAGAQDYPIKPVRFILAFTAGGALDIVARTVTVKVSENLKMQMILENRPGAGGIIGTEIAAKSPPDGYTIFVCNFTNATYPALYQKRTYEPLRDFIPITLAASFAFILSVHPSMPVNSVQQLVELAKRRPDQIAYGSSGIGSPPHFATEMFKVMAGIKMLHVPYAGNPQAQQDLLGGQIQVLFINTANAMPLVKARRIKGLAVSSPQRSVLAPEFPTMDEIGLRGFAMSSWIGFCAPARTPDAVTTRLNAEFMKALDSADVKARLTAQGFEVNALPPDKFQAYFKREIDKYARLVKEAKIEAK